MDFSFSEEQKLLRNSVQRLLQDKYDFDARNSFIASEEGFSREIWADFAELGLLAMPFDEADGGFGHGPVETMIVMEELGAAITVEPYLATVILGGGLLRHGGTAEQRASLIPGIAEGTSLAAFGFAERGGRYNLAHVRTTAEVDGDGYVLNGEKAVVLWGGAVDTVFVTARTSGDSVDVEGITVFAAPADTPGLSRRAYPMVDGTRAAEIKLDGVKLEAGAVVGEVGGGYALTSRVIDEATVALCGEVNGVMRQLRTMTLEYAKQRKQFGQNIGRFQVIQHRLVDMMVANEEAISNTYMATIKIGDSGGSAARAVSAAKAMVGKSARFVGEAATQIHGGMGMTHEMPAAHYFKRLTATEPMFGDTSHHLKRFAASNWK